MKIWWCQEHGYQADEHAVNQTFEPWRKCLGTAYSEASGPYIENKGDYTPCRFVPMRLIPDNGETVERILAVLGSIWPVDPTWRPTERHARRVLAALDGETPVRPVCPCGVGHYLDQHRDGETP